MFEELLVLKLAGGESFIPSPPPQYAASNGTGLGVRLADSVCGLVIRIPLTGHVHSSRAMVTDQTPHMEVTYLGHFHWLDHLLQAA